MYDSLVSPEWELIDPTPDPIALFLQYNDRFFWGKLGAVTVSWSKQMTSCAGICSYDGVGLCSIRLSEPLLKLRPRKDLVETLLHEMIHAFLFITNNNRDRDGHGPEFQKHMHRINASAKTNITIYHTFLNEVRHYKTHVWKCDGPCKDRRPFYGVVRRAMNRAPGPNDRWWKQHQQTCGGKFQKISEPAEFTKNRAEKRKRDTAKLSGGKDDGKHTKITKYFPKSDAGKKKQVFHGTNVLGSSQQPDKIDSQILRRIPGFPSHPVRTFADDNYAASSISSLADNRSSLISGIPDPVNKGETSSSKKSQSNNTSKLSTKTSTNTSSSFDLGRATSSENKTNGSAVLRIHSPISTHRPNVTSTKYPTVMTSDAIILSSDTDDDIPLIPIKPSKKKAATTTLPNLNAHLIESDDQFEDVLNQLHTKKPSAKTPSIAQDTDLVVPLNPRGSNKTDAADDTTYPKYNGNKVSRVTENLPDVIVLDRHVESNEFCICPICGRRVLQDIINEHIDSQCEM